MQANKVKLILGTYNTLNDGVCHKLGEDVYQSAYKPLITLLYNFPEIKASFHFSGSLLYWLGRRHPEFLTVLNEMVSRKQVEIMGGGMYEPLFPMIPSSDRVGQIEMLSTVIRKKFGVRARGCWLPETVWDNSLISPLNTAGMDYVFLNEEAFEDIDVDNKYWPVTTEEQGKSLIVFPLHKELIDIVAAYPVRDFLEKMRKSAENKKEAVISLMLPGTALGYNNGSSAVCYEEKWLEGFFQELRNCDWLETVLPGKLVKSPQLQAPRAYFNPTGLSELMRWVNGLENATGSSIRQKAKKKFGGRHFKNLLSIYPESHRLYSRMIFTHMQTNQIKGDKYRKKSAKEELWKAQNHEAYWHNADGGIYNKKARHDAYKYLIESEKFTRERGIFKASTLAVDFDMDGLKEYLFQSFSHNAYVHLAGGVLFELDYIPSSVNYINSLSRIIECYHNQDILQPALDSYNRKAFHDRFLNEEISLTQIVEGSEPEIGNFIERVYDVDGYARDSHQLKLYCSGQVKTKNGVADIILNKIYQFKRGYVNLQYTIKNCSSKEHSFHFGSELNLSPPSFKEENLIITECLENGISDGTPLENDKSVHLKSSRGVFINDNNLKNQIQIQFSDEASLVYYPLMSRFFRDKLLVEESQGFCLLPLWKFSLYPGEVWSSSISVKIGKSK